jgi:hypothetical protein
VANKLKDLVTVVPLSKRTEEVEERVQYYMSITADSPVNTKKYVRLKIPNFENAAEEREWKLREIHRCRHGHDGMCGRMYFWFHYAYIKNIEGGRIVPEYRVCDHEWFSLVEEVSNTQEGIICVKRRRAGFSWKQASDALYDAMFKKYSTIGMNSKGERDSIELFKKVKFIYDNLPQFLRATSTAGNAKMHMDFSYYKKDEKGNRIKKGVQSNIICVPPTDTAFEGWMLNKWVCDEGGKIPNLPQMWSYTEDCMMQETVRMGTPIIFGTAGDITKEGAGLIDMWNHHEAYDLRRFFFGAWMGLWVDEYGNDRKEDIIRWVLYERKKRETLSNKAQNDFLQKYPLTIKEAFSLAEGGGVGNQAKIVAQINSLEADPPRVSTGYFKADINDPDKILWVSDSRGKVKIYEQPKPILNGYVAGCDPADHDDVTGDASELSLIIRRKQYGTDPPMMVLEYTDRPQKLSEFYTQAWMALVYYNQTKVLIERNRFRMISDFESAGMKRLLAMTPQGIIRYGAGRINTIGVHMNPDMLRYIEDLIEEDVDEYCEFIPSKEVLQEFREWGFKNTDRAMAYGLSLVYAKEDKRKTSDNKYVDSRLPNFSYRRDSNGRIVRVVKAPVEENKQTLVSA